MKKILSIVLILAMITVMVVGCSPKAVDTPPATTPDAPVTDGTPETPAEPVVEKVTLNVAYMPNFGSLNSVVAGMEKGYFEEEGIEVKLVEFADGPTIIAAMESGSIDVGYIGAGAHKLAIQGRTKIFATAHFGNADEVLGNKEKGVNTVQDLRGKTIAMASGTTSETILDLTLEEAGLTKDDVTIMDMDASAIVTAMLSGSVDAAATWSPNTFTIKEDMGDNVVMLSNNKTYVDVVPNIASWIVSPAYAEDHADIVLRFTRALFKAMDYRADNIEEVAKWVAKTAALDEQSVLNQRGDADWIKTDYIKTAIEDGTLEKVYKAQQMNFLNSGAITEEAPVEDYVMFQNMLDAIK